MAGPPSDRPPGAIFRAPRPGEDAPWQLFPDHEPPDLIVWLDDWPGRRSSTHRVYDDQGKPVCSFSDDGALTRWLVESPALRVLMLTHWTMAVLERGAQGQPWETVSAFDGEDSE